MTPAPDQAQRDRATDISRSVIVQAPAGSGKTTLLVERYLKLLAVVDRPEEILAITFTRKAASEMANRILDALQRAAADPESDAATAALARSDELGWQLLAHPARLKIQTIDSLALSLTRGLPVAAGLDPALGLTENAEPLYQRAARQLLLRLYEDGPLISDIADFLRQCDNDAAKAERLLAAMLGKRDQWLQVVSSVVAAHQDDAERVAGVLEQGISELNASVIERFERDAGAAAVAELSRLIDHAAAELGRVATTRIARYRLAGEMLTTTKGEFRRQITRTIGFSPDFPDEKQRLKELIEQLRERALERGAANLRYLPEEQLSSNAVERLVNVCISLALCNAELTAGFRQAGVSDFTTLILNARAALGDSAAPSELALALDYRIHHLLIDEFQDTSVSQFQLFEKLLSGWAPGDGNTFFAVGDPMQSIYRFRDADVGLFYQAWNQGVADIALEPVVLTSNFRADEQLVAWSNHAFARIMGNHEDPVLGQIAYRAATPTQSYQIDHPPVRLKQFESRTSQVHAIAAELERLLQDTPDTIALLISSRSHLTELIRMLRSRGISWRANDIDPLLDKPAVRDLLSLVGALADPYDRLSWLCLLRSPLIGLTLTDLQQLSEVEDFPALLGGVRGGSAATTLSEDGHRRLLRLARHWPANPTEIHELPLRSVVETLWLKCGGADAYEDPGALLHACRLLELLNDLAAEGLSAESLAQAAVKLFAADVSSSRLEILTIHKAKGLEFDHVLVPFLERPPRSSESELLLWRALPRGLLMGIRDDDGSFEWLARENRYRERHERQRLFYVACTRARRSLTLFGSWSDKPAHGTLLAQLWPQIDSGDSGPLVLEQQVAGAAAAEQQMLCTETGDALDPPPPLKRLRPDYAWRAPDPGALPPTAQPAEAERQDPLEARVEVVLGIVVHAALEKLARGTLPDDVRAYIAGEQSRWLAMAAEHDLDASSVQQVVRSAASQVEGVLLHEQGRWLLAADDGAHAELAVTSLLDGEVQNLVIDRTFADGGDRWVVDFKTSIPPPDTATDAFIRSEVARYRPQLDRYGRAAAALFAQSPRLAIYFTALPRFVEL